MKIGLMQDSKMRKGNKGKHKGTDKRKNKCNREASRNRRSEVKNQKCR